MNRHLSEILASVERHLSHSSFDKTILKESDFKKQGTRWKRNNSNSSNMDSETDLKPQWLLRTTNLKSIWQKVARINFTGSSIKYFLAKQNWQWR